MNAHAQIPPRPICPPFTGLPDLPAIAQLRSRDQWVSWDYVWKADRKKWDKPPLDAKTGSAGSSTNPATWSSYDRAAYQTAKSGFAGVGFALSPDDDTTGIDLDKCRNALTGELDAWAAEIVDLAETYAEVSPSGQGIRLFAEGKIAATFKNDKAHVEVYVGGRYLTVTGHHIPGTPTEIRPALRTIEALRNRVEAVRAKIETESAERATAAPKPAAFSSKSPFFRNVNDHAFANLSSWVTALFPTAKRYPGTGAYRVTSRALGRDLEEDLSITAGGIVDFGVADMGDPRDGKRTAIDLVMEHGGAPDAKAAALWLCQQIGIDPARLGWEERKAKTEQPGSKSKPEAEQPGDGASPSLLWYGDKPPAPLPWMVEKTLPETGVAILAGQSGVSKTFVAIDLSGCVMTGIPFAGREVKRQGAVLFLAAEGEEEVDARMLGLVDAKLREVIGDDDKLPFARQAHGVPQLTDADALDKLLKLSREFQDGLATRFPGTGLVLIIVDTIAAAAGFQDENSASETQRVMNVMRALSRQTGALVLVIDHYGKVAETGVRGSSAKQAAADAVLAVVGDKDQVTGKISNRQLAIVKSRGAPTGDVVPFELRPVQIDTWGNTTCVIDWQTETISERAATAVKPPKPAWNGNARVLKSALERAMIDHGQTVRPWGANEKELRAVEHDRVRTEFYGSYPAESQDAKRQAFNRLRNEAIAKQLIASREIAGTDWIWLVRDDHVPDVQVQQKPMSEMTVAEVIASRSSNQSPEA